MRGQMRLNHLLAAVISLTLMWTWACTSQAPSPVPGNNKKQAAGNEGATGDGPTGLSNGSASQQDGLPNQGSNQPTGLPAAATHPAPAVLPAPPINPGANVIYPTQQRPSTLPASSSSSVVSNNGSSNPPSPAAAQDPASAALVGSWTGAGDSLPQATLWSLVTKASCFFTGTSCGSQPPPGSLPGSSTSRKGAGLVKSSGADAGPKLGLKWSYNWTPAAYAGPSGDVEFVPMIARPGDFTAANLAKIKSSGAQVMLGFNEPDHADQANMSVDQVISAWPKLVSVGIRLGSPAPATTSGWFEEFMKKATALNYRIDFIAVHRYPNFGDDSEVDKVKAWLEDLHKRYNKPIWITEFGICSWGTSDGVPMDKVIANMTRMIAMLESLDYLERYAWFTDAPYPSCGRTSLLDGNGNPSPLGLAYKAAGGQ